eukprot:CAMPEP_0198737646 /NCGR_PEP_ID=MMETSP1475-20131203/67974_1 /TAXON_ID= ORGANISM="Unidentified sp., Strain CCMP1999" /NCGR_SAMPLE_ID=MMETSP1475 /ASSEMBLY_ACC=CAM_ASM_001111 /LENGTH=1046 /DNA_ID=CAMNT_0044501515 /DNA_START=310 /DNA_END=3449 /DNA_ORIENTATION=+
MAPSADPPAGDCRNILRREELAFDPLLRNPSDVEERVETKNEVKPVLPRVIPVTVVTGGNAQLTRNFVTYLLSRLANRRVYVVTTSQYDLQPPHARGNGTQKPTTDELDAAAERAEDNGGRENESDVEKEKTSKPARVSSNGWSHCQQLSKALDVLEVVTQNRDSCDNIIFETGGEVLNLRSIALGVSKIPTTRVDTIVSVVDANTFLDDLYMSRDGDEVRNADEELDYQRATNLVNFVESSNVIVLNIASDEVDDDLVDDVEDMILSLNTTATVVRAVDMTVPVDRVMNTNTFDIDTLETAASWKRVLLADREAALGDDGKTSKLLTKNIRDCTFLYRGKRPFHPQRLYNHIKDMRTFSGVVKSVGRLWLATRMTYPLALNQTGGTITLKQGERFWASISEDKWPSDKRDQLLTRWDERFGDRETEIVFVGRNFDRAKLQASLDSCLLQDEEMVFNQAWESFEDPFVVFVPPEKDGSVDENDEEFNEDEDFDEDEDEDVGADEEEEGNDIRDEFREDEDEVREDEDEVRAEEDEVREDDTAKQSPQGRNKDLVDGSEEQEAASLGADSPIDRESEGKKLNESFTAEQTTYDTEPDSTVAEGSQVREGKQSAATGEDQEAEDGGKIDDVNDMPQELLERVSQLHLRPDANPDLYLNPLEHEYKEEDVIIASGDSKEASKILDQIPTRGLPVTVVTGFLGAGKTSLINYILTQNHGLKIAVLVNEFGEVDIDNQLVESDWEDSDTVLLSNGCICCSINDSFLDAVFKILDKGDRVDYLIVETTGIADPVPIVNSLMATELEEMVYVDSIVTLVDAENFDPETHMHSESALSQIAVADTVLLSKTDIAVKKKIDEVISFIHSVRPGARILRSQRGAVPLEMILDVTSKSPGQSAESESDIASRTVRDESDEKDHSNCDHKHGICTHDHEHDHDHDHSSDPLRKRTSNHLEVDGFVSTSFKTTEAFDLDRFFTRFLDNLPAGVFRSKGLLHFKNYPKRYVFQLSGRRYQFEEDDWPKDEPRSNQIVVIGRDLDLKELKAMLNSCRADVD